MTLKCARSGQICARAAAISSRSSRLLGSGLGIDFSHGLRRSTVDRIEGSAYPNMKEARSGPICLLGYDCVVVLISHLIVPIVVSVG